MRQLILIIIIIMNRPDGQKAQLHVIHPPVVLEMSEIVTGHGAQRQHGARQQGQRVVLRARDHQAQHHQGQKARVDDQRGLRAGDAVPRGRQLCAHPGVQYVVKSVRFERERRCSW